MMQIISNCTFFELRIVELLVHHYILLIKLEGRCKILKKTRITMIPECLVSYKFDLPGELLVEGGRGGEGE